MKKLRKLNQRVILSEPKNLMRSFTCVQDDNQCGRSMVEMLGVLAIIGVLSVAGIAGYTTAMRSYRTNEILNAASMLYILATSQNAGNGPTTDPTSYESVGMPKPSGVNTLQYNKDAKSITITFTDTNDCTVAKNKLGDKADDTNCPTLTVNFGETVGGQGNPPACIDGKYMCKYNNGSELYKCVASNWVKEICVCTSCSNLNQELDLDEVCMASLLDCPSGTPCPSGAECQYQ